MNYFKTTLLIITTIIFLMHLPPPISAYMDGKIFVINTDYTSTGSFSLLDIEHKVADEDFPDIWRDAVARFYKGKLYVINRYLQDNIEIFSPPTYDSSLQFSWNDHGSNPHDIAFVSEEEAYISLYSRRDLIAINPKNGTVLKRIDLSSYADSDGIPEMDKIEVIEDRMFISLQRLTGWEPSDYSSILVYNPFNEEVVDTIRLEGTNPYDMHYVPNLHKLVVACTGSWYDLSDGGLETIDLNTYLSEGIQITEKQMGGNIGGAFNAFTIDENGIGYAIVQKDDDWNTKIIQFDIINCITIRDVHDPNTGFVHADLLQVDDLLIVADRNMYNPGVRIFDVSDHDNIYEKTTDPIYTSLPPFCLTLLACDVQIPQTTTTTTTASQPSPCPITGLLENEKELRTLREFRDHILDKNSYGQLLIYFYYNHAGEVTSIMNQHPEITDYAKGLFRTYLPSIVSLVHGERVSLNEHIIFDTITLLKDIKRVSSLQLKNDINLAIWILGGKHETTEDKGEER